MECEAIVVASLIDNVNSCKKIFKIKSSEDVAQDSDSFINNDASNVKTTCLKNSKDLKTPENRPRGIERWNLTRTASSPLLEVGNKPKHCPPSNEVIEDTNTENEMKWKMKPRHVSFDECVHVLTKCSVIEMPLKNSTLENDMSASCCKCTKSILINRGERIGGENVKRVTFEREEQLSTAILNQDLSEFASVCQQWEINFNIKLSNGLAPLHLASITGSFRMVQFILKHGGRVDELDDVGWTALHYASLHGHVTCALVLLHGGADVNALTADYCTVIELATQDEMLLLLGRAMNGVPAKACSLDQNKETYV